MRYLMEEDADKYKQHFSKFIEEEVGPDELEDLYTSVHEAIREDPSPAEKEDPEFDSSYKRPAKKTYEERKAAVEAKKAAMMEEDDDEDDEDDDDGDEDGGDDAEEEEEAAAPAPADAGDY